jgi:CspA family cold shock protein
MPQQGRVKWFNNEKGYGFIERDDGEDVFAHYSSIEADDRFKTLHKGDVVSFEIEDSEKGPKAVRIHCIRTAESV